MNGREDDGRVSESEDPECESAIDGRGTGNGHGIDGLVTGNEREELALVQWCWYSEELGLA